MQRAGRIDRIGSEFDTLWLYNMFPDEGLERLLRLVESLNDKIAHIDRAGFHDASILGEAVHPRNFNTLKRILDEDDSVIEEEEEWSELAAGDVLAQHLRQFLDVHGRQAVEGLPDGIHSGVVRKGAHGVFFYFQAETAEGRQHFWRYADLRGDEILDNRHVIASLIAVSKSSRRSDSSPSRWSASKSRNCGRRFVPGSVTETIRSCSKRFRLSRSSEARGIRRKPFRNPEGRSGSSVSSFG